MADADLGSVTKRLDRIEEALARLGGLLHPVVDPPPEDLGRLRPDLALLWQLIHRPPRGDPAVLDLARRRPVADPAATDRPAAAAGTLEDRLNEILQRNPGWFADPPPEDFLNVRLLDLIRRWRGGFTDPAPEDFANVRLRDLLQRIPGGGFTDPAPGDLARLTSAELETQLHRVNAEAVRLKSLERMLTDRLNQVKKTQPKEGK